MFLKEGGILKFRKYLWFFFILLFSNLIVACSFERPTQIQPTANPVAFKITPTSAQHIETITPFPIPSSTPTELYKLNEDTDGDGYINSWELAWNTDPAVKTTFDDLLLLPNVISFTLFRRAPYNLESINLTPYQQIQVISEEIIQDQTSSGMKENPWKTVELRVVTFPFVTSAIHNYSQKLIVPYEVPEEVKSFLEFSKTSNNCPELQEINTEGRTLAEVVSNWQEFTNRFIKQDSSFEALPYMEMVSMDACSMIISGRRSDSTTLATLFVSFMRASSIPAAITYSFDPTDINQDLHNKDLEKVWTRSNDHPQVAVWTPDYDWIILDPISGFIGARENKGIVFSEITPDMMDLDLTAIEGTVNLSAFWTFYSTDLEAPEDWLHMLQPDEPGY